MSKGSGRRPQQEPDESVAESWERIFGQKAEQPSDASEANEQSKGE